jgi:hypothetical protein
MRGDDNMMQVMVRVNVMWVMRDEDYVIDYIYSLTESAEKLYTLACDILGDIHGS